MNKTFIVTTNHNGSDIFYLTIDDNDFIFAGIRSKAHHFNDEDKAKFVADVISDCGYESKVEIFYTF